MCGGPVRPRGVRLTGIRWGATIPYVSPYSWFGNTNRRSSVFCRSSFSPELAQDVTETGLALAAAAVAKAAPAVRAPVALARPALAALALALAADP